MQQQLPDLAEVNIVLESEPKESSAAIGLAAAILNRRHPGVIVGSFAADHVISDGERFRHAVAEAVAVARTGPSTYIAFSLACPHQGAFVQGGSQGWTCPAHGSTFEADGRLIMGPATKRLTRVPATLRRGVLTVG